MRIANVMFGRGRGGIEQAFLDYNEALLLAGHEVLAITHPLAIVNTQITGELQHASLTNYGNWDPFCARRLTRLYQDWKPDILISHGNRALHLNHRSNVPAMHVGVTHNYHLKHCGYLDAAIAITPDLAMKARDYLPAERIAQIPNMVRIPKNTPGPNGEVPVIGAMGRMVPKKGFQLLLEAAGILKQREVEFKLLLGGEGPEYRNLRRLVQHHGLGGEIEFLNWVEEKKEFFAEIDIFCLPSLHEPFGIVLLEAMAHGKPVVSYASEGPKAIIQHDEAWMIPPGNTEKLADALQRLLQSRADQQALIERGKQLVAEKYALPIVSRRIDEVLQSWYHDYALANSSGSA